MLEYYARKGYYEQDNKDEHEYGKDIMWYIWSNENSPVYGKEKMATFERYFIADKEVQIERKDHYYRLIEKEEVVNNILKEFNVDVEKGHIINGHMPCLLYTSKVLKRWRLWRIEWRKKCMKYTVIPVEKR